MVRALRGSRRPLTPLEELTLAMPRAPPGVEVLVRDGRFPVPGVIAFGWAERGAVVITRAVAEQVAGRFALDPDGVQAWWDRLLSHEVEFHLGDNPEHTGPRHDADAAPIAADWFGRPAPHAPRPMTGAGGARSPPPATVWIWREKGMPRFEFRRKAEELRRLGDAGLLHKARNPVARDSSVTRRYTADLVRRITTVIGSRNPEHAARLVRRVTELMDPDHVHELQLGGGDVAANIRMLDRLTNRGIGSRQLRPQLMALPDGTPVRVEVMDIADLGARISTVVGEGTLTYRRLTDIFGVPKAVLRGAVRDDDTLREVGRKHAVRRAGSRDERGDALRLEPLTSVAGLAMVGAIGGWDIAAATVLGLAAFALGLIGIKAAVDALRRRNARAAAGTDTGDVLERAAPAAPEAGGPPGARKPPGSHMPEEDLAPALRGEEMPADRRAELAAALSAEVRLPGERAGSRLLLDAESLLLDGTGRFGEWVQRRTRRSGPDRHTDPRRVLSTFVLLTRRLLLDDRRLRWLPIPPPVWRELAEPVEDPTLRPLAVDAGFRWEGGRLNLFVIDAEGAVHEVVESMLARFAGLPDEARHAVAVLAERAADPSADPGSWLTTRTLRDLDRLARENPAALDRLIAHHERVLGVDIDVAFAGLPAWRDVARTYVEQFREAAVARIPHRDVPRAVVDREAKEALRELRTLVRDLPGFTRADRRYVRGIRPYWNDEVYEGVIPQIATGMKRAAARHRLDVTDAELLALAARRTCGGRCSGSTCPTSRGLSSSRCGSGCCPPSCGRSSRCGTGSGAGTDGPVRSPCERVVLPVEITRGLAAVELVPGTDREQQLHDGPDDVNGFGVGGRAYGEGDPAGRHDDQQGDRRRAGPPHPAPGESGDRQQGADEEHREVEHRDDPGEARCDRQQDAAADLGGDHRRWGGVGPRAARLDGEPAHRLGELVGPVAGPRPHGVRLGEQDRREDPQYAEQEPAEEHAVLPLENGQRHDCGLRVGGDGEEQDDDDVGHGETTPRCSNPGKAPF
jgi:hypothetical protein